MCRGSEQCERPHRRQRVDLADRLVVADAHDAREAERVAGGMAGRRLHDIERHLQDDLGTDAMPAAVALDREQIGNFSGVFRPVGLT